MNPKVSIISGVYNGSEHLSVFVDSILAQTLKDFEFIIVDDGSTDETPAILKKYARQDSRITIIRQKNAGVGMARNAGLKRARGEYLLFIDADDYFKPDMVKRFYQKAKATNADVVIGGYQVFEGTIDNVRDVTWDVFTYMLPDKSVFSVKDCPAHIFNFASTSVWDKMFKHSFIKKYDLWMQDVENTEDAYFSSAALSVAERIAVVKERLILYRVGQGYHLTNRREKSWKYLGAFLPVLKEFLDKHHLYKYVEKSYLNRVLSIMTYWAGEQLKEPIQTFSQHYLLDTLAKPLGMANHPANYYYEPKGYKLLQRLLWQKNNVAKLKDLYDHKRDKIVPIVFAVNDYYAPYAGVAIQSIIEHMNPNRFYDIYILHNGLSETWVDALSALQGDNYRVKCFDVWYSIKDNCPFYEQSYYSKATFYRLLVADVLYGYSKILYLDCDLIVESDVAELFDTDIGENIVGAVRNPVRRGFDSYCENTLHILPEVYFNAGVLLINLDEWRKQKIYDECLKLIDPKEPFLCPDQDTLNIVLEDKISWLSPQWNCLWPLSLPAKEDYHQEVINWWNEHFNKGAKIIHYTSAQKPWKNPQYPLAWNWWKYARLSPFYETILQQNVNATPSATPASVVCPVKKIEERIPLLSIGELMQHRDICHDNMSLYVRKALGTMFSFGKKRAQKREELRQLYFKMCHQVYDTQKKS